MGSPTATWRTGPGCTPWSGRWAAWRWSGDLVCATSTSIISLRRMASRDPGRHHVLAPRAVHPARGRRVLGPAPGHVPGHAGGRAAGLGGWRPGIAAGGDDVVEGLG